MTEISPHPKGLALFDTVLALNLLRDWALHAERYWYPIPDASGLGCYGTGYNAWGVQTNQKFTAAMAVLTDFGHRLPAVPTSLCEQARERALAALRFSLHSHLSGEYRCTDGTQWGHTWISALGIERMMHGVYLLEPHFADEDHATLRRVLCSEADWLLHHHTRGKHTGVFADVWNHSGKNAPESNLWNGALLWRAAVMYPDHPSAAAWRERAHQFLINAVSIAADADDDRIVAGRKVREWHVGAGFFPNYALDHHGYLNVGYMVICLSNAAMLHFDMRARGLPAPESLYHHNADLWRVLRRLIFSDGRLARAGGDTRVRYAYCQEYLLPALIYAADHLEEPFAAPLVEGQLNLISGEASHNGDGSFYGRRLAPLAEQNPYYYTRLESDRACALGMLVAYANQLQTGEGAAGNSESQATRLGFERSVAGDWCEPDHGVALHRAPSRLVSFSWRANKLAQGLCQPPDDGHLAEWSFNLAGYVRFTSDDGATIGTQRKLIDYTIDTFPGGFLTVGKVREGVGLTLAEGWHGRESATHQLAFIALPDGHTALGFQHCRTFNHRTYVAEVKGLHLNLPNDLYNEFGRRLTTAKGEVHLQSPPEENRVLELGSAWANIEGRVGVLGLYGADQLVVHRSRERRGGQYHSLYVEEICYPCSMGTVAVDPGTTLLDVGWAVLSGAGQERTRRFAERSRALSQDNAKDLVRGIRVQGLNGREYVVLVNFGDSEISILADELYGAEVHAYDLVTEEEIHAGQDVTLIIKPCHMRVFVGSHKHP
jgi:hypothetical protein